MPDGSKRGTVDVTQKFDAIFFDTYGEYYSDMHDLHNLVATLLKPKGIYSFFNGA